MLKQNGGPQVIGLHVVTDFVHALSNSDRSSKMINGINSSESTFHNFWIDDVSVDKFDMRVQIFRRKAPTVTLIG